MTKNPHFHGCVKHIDTRHHFICEQVLNRKINLEYCPTEDMTADILTKGLNRELFDIVRTVDSLKFLSKVWWSIGIEHLNLSC